MRVRSRSSNANERPLMTAPINKAMPKIVARNGNETMRKSDIKKLDVTVPGMLTHKLRSHLTSNFFSSSSFLFYQLHFDKIFLLLYSITYLFFSLSNSPQKFFFSFLKKTSISFKVFFLSFRKPQTTHFLKHHFSPLVFQKSVFFSHAVHRLPCSPSFSSFLILSLFPCLSIASTTSDAAQLGYHWNFQGCDGPSDRIKKRMGPIPIHTR